MLLPCDNQLSVEVRMSWYLCLHFVYIVKAKGYFSTRELLSSTLYIYIVYLIVGCSISLWLWTRLWTSSAVKSTQCADSVGSRLASSTAAVTHNIKTNLTTFPTALKLSQLFLHAVRYAHSIPLIGAMVNHWQLGRDACRSTTLLHPTDSVTDHSTFNFLSRSDSMLTFLVFRKGET